MNAIIKDNKVYCPFCNEHNYRIGPYKQLKEGTQITAICNNCNREFEYMLNLKIDNAERFINEMEEEE